MDKPLTPRERFEMALWNAETAIQEALDLAPEAIHTKRGLDQLRSDSVKVAMMMGMLMIAKSTVASIRQLDKP